MFPDSRARAPKTAIVITARTTPYSAIVCPSSRRGELGEQAANRLHLVHLLGGRRMRAEGGDPESRPVGRKKTISVNGGHPSRCSVWPLHRCARQETDRPLPHSARSPRQRFEPH